MIAPIFANGIEIKTIDKEGNPAGLVILRFLYQEKYAVNKEIHTSVMPVATILIPRAMAKDFMKKFYGLMSVEDEHGNRNIHRESK